MWLSKLDRARYVTYMGSLLCINSNFPLVQVWNKDPVALLVMQILCLPFDFVSDAPPFLHSKLVC